MASRNQKKDTGLMRTFGVLIVLGAGCGSPQRAATNADNDRTPSVDEDPEANIGKAADAGTCIARTSLVALPNIVVAYDRWFSELDALNAAAQALLRVDIAIENKDDGALFFTTREVGGGVVTYTCGDAAIAYKYRYKVFVQGSALHVETLCWSQPQSTSRPEPTIPWTECHAMPTGDDAMPKAIADGAIGVMAARRK